MKLRGLLVANLALISFAVTMPVAHVFTLPQRFALDAKLWTQAFEYFHRAWSIYAGGVAVAALLMSLALVVRRRKSPLSLRLSLNAVFVYAALSVMIFVSGAAELEHVVALALALTACGWLALLSATLSPRVCVARYVRASQP